MKSLFRKILIGICGVFGLTSCAYGCPYADYRITGHVSDENGDPVKGIQVYCMYDGAAETSASGNYKMDFEGIYIPEDAVIVFEDTDGEENGGEFEKATLPLSESDFVQTKKGGRHWYHGAFEAKHKDIVLQLKTEDESGTDEENNNL